MINESILQFLDGLKLPTRINNITDFALAELYVKQMYKQLDDYNRKDQLALNDQTSLVLKHFETTVNGDTDLQKLFDTLVVFYTSLDKERKFERITKLKAMVNEIYLDAQSTNKQKGKT
jgi:hypothetical protein